MIEARHIFALVQTPLSWHDDVKTIQDVRAWSANSPSERSGAISDICRPTRAFAVRTQCSMVARAVQATPSTRSATLGFGARFPRSDEDFVSAEQPRTHCAQTALSMPIGQRSRPRITTQTHRVVAESAASATGKPKATAALGRRAIAVISPSAASPCPRSFSARASMRQQHLASLARPWRAAQTQAVARIALPHLATDAADAIAARLADNCPHSHVTHAEVAQAHPGFPYPTYSLRAPSPSWRRLSLGDHP